MHGGRPGQWGRPLHGDETAASMYPHLHGPEEGVTEQGDKSSV